VLSAEYRLAPEHPFPAAADDAIVAFEYVAEHAVELGVEPRRIAVGGDSSGRNLAAVVAHAAARSNGPRPAFSMLLYPATDALGNYNYRSYQLFGCGFRIDDEERDWHRGQYLTTEDLVNDPRVSVPHDTQLDGLPPTFVATSGFDPLRDEGEACAVRLRAAGVPVIHRRHDGMLHGFVTQVGIDPEARAALQHAAGALRAGLALAEHASSASSELDVGASGAAACLGADVAAGIEGRDRGDVLRIQHEVEQRDVLGHALWRNGFRDHHMVHQWNVARGPPALAGGGIVSSSSYK
jgi:hypothetical protein